MDSMKEKGRDPEFPEEYLAGVAEEYREAFAQLRSVILENLPEGFEEAIQYGMIGYVVPHRLYPSGYHANRKLPLPFISLAAQKHHIALYHMGLYAHKPTLDWFMQEIKESGMKIPDMGKSCLRFKDPRSIPYDLIARLVERITPDEWIDVYESVLKK